MSQESYDAVVVGAGFAGIFQLKRLRDDLGLKCLVRNERPAVKSRICRGRSLSDSATLEYTVLIISS